MAEKQHKLTFNIPLEGSLGILALGAVGLRAWRKKRAEHALESDNLPKNEF